MSSDRADLMRRIHIARELIDPQSEYALRLEYSQFLSPDEHEAQTNALAVVTLGERLGRTGELCEIVPDLAERYGSYLHITIPFIRLAIDRGDYCSARRYIDLGAAAHPGNEWPVLCMADLLEAQGKAEEALELLEHSLPNLREQYAFLNVADRYFAIACARFKNNIQPSHTPTGVDPAIPNALFVCLVKDEADIIYANLKHHYDRGFRNYVLIDNDSVDTTWAEIDRFRHAHPSATVFRISDPIVGYVQDAKTSAASHFAVSVLQSMEYPIKWVFAIDADEFICTQAGIPLIDVLHAADAAGRKALTFVEIRASTQTALPELPRTDELLEIFSRREPYPRRVSHKVALVQSARLYFELGNHRPRADFMALHESGPASEFGAFLLHLTLRSARQARSKVLNGMRGLKAAPHEGAGYGGHWREWYKGYLDQGDAYFIELLRQYIDSIACEDVTIGD